MPWISGNYELTLAEMQNNVDMIHAFFRAQGWTDNAISGMLGNMQAESTINPGRWESGVVNPDRNGFGLVQWTPGSTMINWAESQGLQPDNGTAQCRRIIYELNSGIQYYPTTNFPLTFKEFTESEQPPSYLAATFLYNYERPSDPMSTLLYREQQAGYWYEYITGQVPPEPKPPASGYKIPWIMWMRPLRYE